MKVGNLGDDLVSGHADKRDKRNTNPSPSPSPPLWSREYCTYSPGPPNFAVAVYARLIAMYTAEGVNPGFTAQTGRRLGSVALRATGASHLASRQESHPPTPDIASTWGLITCSNDLQSA